tara:strand:+ start:234 stop:530 length:297 start_codon:yes stop_codon:yes gene_type:complete
MPPKSFSKDNPQNSYKNITKIGLASTHHSTGHFAHIRYNLRVPFILNLEEKLVRQICLNEFGLATKMLFLRAFPEKITLGRGNIFKTICLNKLPDFIS